MTIAALQVFYFQATPLRLQVFKDQPPVTVLGIKLTAQKDGWLLKISRTKVLFYLPRGH
jgi:hypothetical protein